MCIRDSPCSALAPWCGLVLSLVPLPLPLPEHALPREACPRLHRPMNPTGPAEIPGPGIWAASK
eukprot:15197339-Alexandrium_andersonii.AAC.1